MTPIVAGNFVIAPQPGLDAELKAMGARWSGGAWSLPATMSNAVEADHRGLGLDLQGALGATLSAPTPLPDTRLFPYQREAAGRLVDAEHGLLLCLSPGLGKTVVSIVAADAAVPDDKIVVVAPASLLRTWEREIRKWATVPGDTYVLQGKPDFDAARDARWIITSWDKAVREAGLWGRGWPLWILDESVLAKSRGSKRFTALKKIRSGVQRFWLLSGSPTTRHADDLWAQLHLLWPAAFPSYWRFAERYTVIEQTPWSRAITGNRVGRDAAVENRDLILTVGQDDVLDLPEYLFEPPIVVALGGAQAKAYRSMHDDFVAELKGQEIVAANEAAKLTQLQRIASFWDGESAKRDALLDALPNYEPPYLIWTHWRETARDLGEALTAAGVSNYVVNGETSQSDRDAHLEGYKAGAVDALVLSMGVGKFGHTLVNTKTVFGIDRSFNADDFFQSLHRVRRIGLTHRPVFVPIVAAGTVDELTVGDNLESKLGGIARMTRSDLATLLKAIGR